MDAYQAHLVDEVRAGRLSRRDFIRRASIAGLTMSGTAAALAGCWSGNPNPQGSASTSAGPVQRGGSVRVVSTEASEDVDPVTMYSAGAYFIAQMALDYLVWPRPDFSLAPRLATKWKARKPDEWEFTLRTDVHWQDGKPLTAADVAYTFDLLTDPKGSSAALSAFKGILSPGNTEKVDDHTVVFHLDRSFVDFPSLLSPFNYNACILPKGYRIGQFLKGGVGTGAFKLEKWTPKVGGTFVRNPKYWRKGLPYLDRAEIRYYGDTSSAVLAMQGGEVDLYPQLAYSGAQPLIKSSDVQIMQIRSNSYRELFMRTDRTPFDDKRVRQALALCIDREAIVKGVMGGYAEVANDHGFAPILLPQSAVSNITQRKQDHEEAKRLLAAAGHPRGFSATLTTGQYLELPDYVTAVKQQCRDAGIDLELDVQSVAQFYGSGDNQPWLEVPLGCVDWNARGSSSQLIEPAYSSHGIWNSANWKNSAFDVALREYQAEQDEQKRHQLAAKAAAIQHEEVPAVIAYWLKELRAVSSKVHGLAKGPNDMLDLSTVWLSQ